jgi:signal transduction histidine kinase/CheY-like chemotaxis protein
MVLVLAPTGRDSPLACDILNERAHVPCEACADVLELCRRIALGAGAVLIAEEALDSPSAWRLADALAAQLPWSDIPLLVLASAPETELQGGGPLTVLRERGNVTLLDRPLRIVTLVTAVQAALRARRRQYEVRDLLAATRAAVRQRDQFLAMLGHELRNPLATITNALSVLETVAPPNAVTPNQTEREQREIITRQTGNLARLVDDLLDVARITSGKVQLQRRPVDLCEIVSRAARAVSVLAHAQSHDVTVSTTCDRVIVDGDPVRLEQVVNNLLTNAIKYTPAGGRIQLQVGQSGEEAALRVRDNGIGIPNELISRVFDLFTQAERSLDRAQGGMGIGLTLVRQLVEMHGGSVSVSSEGSGRGSEFIVRLPAIKYVQTPPQPSPAPQPEAAGRHVLVIEDNADARGVMRRLLTLWGHKVDVAEDGPRGVDVACSIRPELALIDVGLPGLDGYEVARRVRSCLGDRIRLIALTGYGQPEDRARALDAGFDLHLVKPVNPQLLRTVLANPDAVLDTAAPATGG